MKFLKSTQDKLVFQISAPEKRVLFQALRLYPLVPASYPKLSRGNARPEDQQLLEDSLAGQRAENRRLLLALMGAESRFVRAGGGFRLELSAAEAECLLQSLNDVRVGGWLALGSPDGQEQIEAALNDETAKYLWAMEVAGFFQMALLQALRGE